MGKPQPTPTKSIGPLWNYYRATLHFLTKVCGSVPADPELVRKWLEAREPDVKPAGARSIDEINDEVVASLEAGRGEPSQEFSLLTFQRIDGRCAVRAATVRAHLKDCARVLSAQFIGREKGERAFSTRVINGLYHDEREYWLFVRRPDGAPVLAVDGSYDKPIHAYGPTGPINALKRIEYIDPPASLTVTLKVLGQSLAKSDLDYVLTYGGTHGYGGERSDGQGRYEYELEAVAEPAAHLAAATVGAADSDGRRPRRET